jgi:hypothetical protein
VSNQLKELQQRLNTVSNTSAATSPAPVVTPPNGRWLCRSGTLLRGGWVPWEVEAVNTAPACLGYERSVSGITATPPGLYCLTAGFFTLKAFSAYICVNGEPIVMFGQGSYSDDQQQQQSNAAVDSNSSALAVVGSNGASLKRKLYMHSAGDVYSCSVLEYVALPAHSVLSVRFESDIKAQGFLGLQKL